MAANKPQLNNKNMKEMIDNIPASSSPSCSYASGWSCGTGDGSATDCGYSYCYINQTNDGGTCGVIGAVDPGGCNGFTDSNTNPCKGFTDAISCGLTGANVCILNPYGGTTPANHVLDNEVLSIDLFVNGNEIKITADSSYPVDKLVELCSELSKTHD